MMKFVQRHKRKIISSIWNKTLNWKALFEVQYMLLHQPYFSWNSLGNWGYIFLTETKRNEKCGWGCFFQGPWRVCKWSETYGVASGWAWVWIGTLHLGHMCRQQGQKFGDPEPKIPSRDSFSPFVEEKSNDFTNRTASLYLFYFLKATQFLANSRGNVCTIKLPIIRCVYETTLMTHSSEKKRRLQTPDFPCGCMYLVVQRKRKSATDTHY